MERGNNSYRRETTVQDGWVKIGVLGCNSVIPRNVDEPPTGDGTAVGNAASATAADSLALGDWAAAHGQKSVAIGSGSVASNDSECSVGAPATESATESTREVTHVSEPTAPTSAANKNYVDANTSNAFIGTAYGNPTAHIEDAWPSKPLELAVAGAYKQGDTTKPPIVEGDDPSPEDQVLMVTGADTSDTSAYSQNGTPSPTNPVPIEVVENLVLRMTGADTSAAGASIPITLPAEHPYLAALPDGTRDAIVIDRDGNATLVAKVGRDTDVREITDVAVGQYFGLKTTLPPFASADAMTSKSALCSAVPYLAESYGVYRTWTGVYVKYGGPEDKDQLQSIFAAAAPMTVLATIPETRYSLGKLDIPALPETISNVWVESNLATMARMMYKLDANKTVLRPSSSIIFENGSVKVNPVIFGSGLLATDNNVRVDSNFINDRFKEFVKRLDYSFFGPFTVEFSNGFTGTKNEFGEIQHSYAGNIEHYEIYKANFRYTLTRSYAAGTEIKFTVQFKYGGNHATVTNTTITKVVNCGTGITIAHVTPKYDGGYHPSYMFTVPVSADIPSGTKLAFFMELCN